MDPTVAVAAIGIVGTLGGVLITQWRSDAREKAAWAREDADRTFAVRRDAYRAFYRFVTEFLEAVDDMDPDNEAHPDLKVASTATPAFEDVAIYGSTKAKEAAAATLIALNRYAIGARRNFTQPDPEVPAYKQAAYNAQAELLAAIRADLGVDALDAD